VVPVLKSRIVGKIVLAVGIGCLVGMIYAFNQHGGIVYLTHLESILPKALFVSAAILIAVGGYIYNNWRADQAKSH
jgi:hypothetical protein